MTSLAVPPDIVKEPIDLGLLIAPFKAMGETEALTVAKYVFGIEGRVKRFATEKDDTFRLEANSGEMFVLKVANPAEDALELDLQVAILEHLEQSDLALPAPRARRTKAGDRYGSITDNAGQWRKVRLMTYLEGTPLDDVPSTSSQREQIGAVLAKLRTALANFSHPATHRVVPWDVKNLPRLAHLLKYVGEPEHAAMLEEGLARFAAIAPRVARLRKQVLHNDFSKSNLVVDASEPCFVTGIIDFGDAVHTAIAIDVSTALLNQLPRNTGALPSDDMFADARDVLRGYMRHADLTDEELALVPHLVMARVVTRALLSLGLAKRFPENATYLLRNTQQGWAQLEWFLRRSPEQIAGALTQ